MPERDEFFVGYEERMPRGYAACMRAAVAALFVVALALALLLVAAQQRFDAGVFELGVTRGYAGVLVEMPYPMLVGRSRDGGAEPAGYLLVATGKRGAAEMLAGWDGRTARLEGTLVRRGRGLMIEIVEGSVRAWEGEEARAFAAGLARRPVDLGRHTVAGEIVDSKCFLGVMKPGRGKTHRSCAARCISGGIPPALALTDERGRTTLLLLAGADGRAVNDELLPLVAEPVEITGHVIRTGDRLVLRADPATYRPLR